MLETVAPIALVSLMGMSMAPADTPFCNDAEPESHAESVCHATDVDSAYVNRMWLDRRKLTAVDRWGGQWDVTVRGTPAAGVCEVFAETGTHDAETVDTFVSAYTEQLGAVSERPYSRITDMDQWVWADPNSNTRRVIVSTTDTERQRHMSVRLEFSNQATCLDAAAARRMQHRSRSAHLLRQGVESQDR